jgi:hypothetical protein
VCRYVIQEIIKDMARNRSVDSKRRIKVLVLHEVDSLSKQAQHSLRRTMEKYSSVCRLVMLCSTVSKVLEPVRSRCLCVRTPAPAEAKIMDVLMHVSSEESLSLPAPLAAKIVAASARDLRKALLCLECCRVAQFPFTDSQEPRLADWELYIMVRCVSTFACADAQDALRRLLCNVDAAQHRRAMQARTRASRRRAFAANKRVMRAGDCERHPDGADAEAAARGARQGLRAARQRRAA